MEWSHWSEYVLCCAWKEREGVGIGNGIGKRRDGQALVEALTRGRAVEAWAAPAPRGGVAGVASKAPHTNGRGRGTRRKSDTDLYKYFPAIYSLIYFIRYSTMNLVQIIV